MTTLRHIFETLREFYKAREPMPWWPENPIEVIVGAVLVQGATWKSVDRVLQTLKDANLLDFSHILGCSDEELANLIRSVGFQSKKVARLKALSQLFLDRSKGQIPAFFARDVDEVRRDLLAISGIGPGTADNILLYAGKIPIYMVDPFTERILSRHGIVRPFDREPEIQRLIHLELSPDEEPYGAKLFCDFQALIVRVGRDYCDKTHPDCVTCPLCSMLPDGVPLHLTGTAQTTKTSTRSAQVLPKRLNLPPFASQTATSAMIPSPKPEFQNETEQKIYETLDAEPMPIDLLVQKTGLPVHVVRATIAILEMRRTVRQLEGNQVQRL